MIALVLAAALAAPTISHAEIRPTYAGATGTAAYFTAQSPVDDRLMGAACDCAASVELHQTVVKNGVAQMTGPEPVTVTAGHAVIFAPGGRHLMVSGLKGPLKPGQSVKITLRFEKAGPVETVFAVKAQGDGGMGHGGMGDMPGMPGMDHH